MTWRLAAAMVALALAACGEGRSQPGADVLPNLCMDEASRDKVRGIALEAVDAALQAHIAHMFEVWMRDTSRQPERARAGVQRGIAAYLQARSATLRWSPPSCA
jgi:hypothetical protein